jgi:protein SCO1/2
MNSSRVLLWLCAAALGWAGVSGCERSDGTAPQSASTLVRSYNVAGIIRSLSSDRHTVVVAHESIAGYMEAMTMPFRVRDPRELAGLQPGDQISFRLQVTDSQSWIDQLVKTATAGTNSLGPAQPAPPSPPPTRSEHPLMTCHFTNELGRAVTLSDFPGQALAITFFFTRCPIPEYCPRLSANFAEASRQLSANLNAPTNWHFLSVSFDPEHDTPPVLKGYGERYGYDPKHWSFLTGPLDAIAALAKESNVQFERDGGFYNHSFRTLVVDPNFHLQAVFPTSGDLSAALVTEIIKAAAVTVTNRSSDSATSSLEK